MKGLTEKQRLILNYIEDFMNTTGMAPTVYEIAAHFRIKTSTVFAHLQALQKKRFLSRSSKARSLALLKPRRKTRHPGGLRAIPVIDNPGNWETTFSGPRREFYCDSSLFKRTLHSDCRTLYALRIRGGGMVEKGILEGDIAIVKRHPETLKEGDIILLSQGNGEGCVLRSCLRCSNGRLAFSDGSTGNVEECALKDLPLCGVVVGVQRSL